MTDVLFAVPSLAAELYSRLPLPVYLLRWEEPGNFDAFRLIGANPAGAARLRPGQTMGSLLQDAFPGIVGTHLPKVYARALTTGEPQETALEYRDEYPLRRYVLRAIPLSDDHLAIVAQDVTADFVRAERLRLDHALMERAQQLGRIGTIEWHEPENRVRLSDQMYALLGTAPAEFGGTMEAFVELVFPDDRDEVRTAFVHAAQAREPLRMRTRFLRRDGDIRWLEVAAVTDLDDAGAVTGLRGIGVDVTDSLRSELEQQQEDSARLMVSRIKEYAIFMLDPEGRVVSWNEGAERMKGYRPSEIIGQYFGRFYEPERQAEGIPAQLLRQAAAQGHVEDIGWRVRKDGTRFWADVVITALFDDDGRLRGFGKVTRDLTEQREAEASLSELAARLLQNQDDERRRVARELHDATSPLLAGIMTRLYSARSRVAAADATAGRLLEESATNAEAVATVIRTVSALLHPPLLDDSGLLPSLRWYLSALESRTGLRVRTQFPALMPRQSQDVETAAFRLVQECLTSVTRQTGATEADVTLDARAGRLTVQVTLSGGHSLPTGRDEAGVGIAGLRERIRQLDGELDVRAAAGMITVTAALPLHNR